MYFSLCRNVYLKAARQGGWFDLISKSKCISGKTETILQLAVISCADDSGWQCRVTDVPPGPGEPGRPPHPGKGTGPPGSAGPRPSSRLV